MKAVLANGRGRAWLGAGARSLPVLALVLLPKCPVCLAMYFGFLTAYGVNVLTAARWTFYLLIAAGAGILVKLALESRVTGQGTAFWLAATGFASLLAGQILLDSPGARWLGLALFCVGCAKRGLPACARAKCQTAHPLSDTPFP